MKKKIFLTTQKVIKNHLAKKIFAYLAHMKVNDDAINTSLSQ